MLENNGDISLKEFIIKIKKFWKYLLSKWAIIALMGCIGAASGFLYAITKKPMYDGSLSFVLSNDGKSGGGLANLAGQFGFDISGGGTNSAFEGENIIELLRSRRIVKGALFKKVPEEKDILVNIIADEAGLFKAWKKNKRTASLIPFPENMDILSPIQDSMVNVVYGMVLENFLNVGKTDKKLSFYQVTTISPKESISIYLTKNVVDEAAKMYIETKTKMARDNLRMLQFEADSLRNRLGGTLYSSANKIDQTFNLNPALQTQRVPIQQNQVQTQILVTAYGEVIKNLEIAKIALQKATPLYQVIDEPEYPLTKKKFSRLKGIILGGFLGVFIIIAYFLIGRIYKSIMEN